MNYFLAIDKTRSKEADKSDRYFIVDLSLLDSNQRNSIESITEFTKNFKSEQELMFYLISHNIVPRELLGKHFTICYKSPKDHKWTRCGYKIKDQSSVLFDQDANLLDPGYFFEQLISLGIAPDIHFNYETCDANDAMKINLLSMLVRELQTNEMYKYHYIANEVNSLNQYLLTIKNDNYVDNKYFSQNINDIVCGIYYKYSKFDYDKMQPLTNKQNKRYTNVRHLFELAIFFSYCKHQLESQTKLLSQAKIDKTTGEILMPEEKQLVRKKSLNKAEVEGQLSFFDIID